MCSSPLGQCGNGHGRYTSVLVFYTLYLGPIATHAAPDLKRLLFSQGFDYSSVGTQDIYSLKILCCIPRSPIIRKIYLLRKAGSVFPVSCLPPTEQEVN